MKNSLVTVIVPVYNTEKYLDRCVESIVNQTYRNLEIILIDDGSTDNCPQMCDTWAQKDPRIRVIHQLNAGAGMTRNAGLDAANGEYVCFMDSDDYADQDMILSALSEAQKYTADLLLYGMSNVDTHGFVISSSVPNPPKKIYFDDEVQQELLRHQLQTAQIMSLCGALFSKKMIDRAKWRIPSERNVYSEDTYAMIDIYGYAKIVSILPKSYYYYCNNGASLSHSKRAGDYEGIKNCYIQLLELCKKHTYSSEIGRKCILPFLGFTIACLKYHTAMNGKMKTRIAKIREIVEDPILQGALEKLYYKDLNWKRMILVWAMRKKYITLCYMFLWMQNMID